MKTRWMFFLFIPVILGTLTVPGLTQEEMDEAAKIKAAGPILEKMIQASGGRKILSTIQDATMSGTIEMIQMGLDGSIVMYQKEPDKMRMDIEIMGMIITRAYDGEIAWMVNPQTGTAEELPDQYAEDLKKQSFSNAVMLDPESLGIKYTFEGRENIEDKDYLIIIRHYESGDTSKIYVDPDTHLVFKEVSKSLGQMGIEVEAETFLSDYKEVEGTLVAHTITVFQDGEEFMTMTIDEIKYNSGLEDSFFKMDG